MLPKCIDYISGLDGDLSSSDDNLPQKRRHQSRRSNNKGGPSIRDGPDAIARLIDRSRKPNSNNSGGKILII